MSVKSTLTDAAESGAKKAAETAVNRAVNALADFVKQKYREHKVDIGAAFERYLENASLRYNKVRTIATGDAQRTVIGDDSIYVSIGVKYGQSEFSSETAESILRIGNNILISGSGGVGKSMLMRYLFLNAAKRGNYVPVLLELRRISGQSSGQISVLELIYSCMKDFDADMDKEQLEYSLRSGCYLFLLDGFDEVKDALAAEAAEVIQSFCSKYPKNSCIITSRPRQDANLFETFRTADLMPMNKKQAVLLASKIRTEDEKTAEFCRQLDETLYEQHRDFAENPLLLSMMFLTFIRSNSIPEHLSDFYQKAYDALYSAHDTNNKGSYKRDFKCKSLDEGSFRLLLSRFCFQTYFKEIYEFSEKSILSLLGSSIQKLRLENTSAKDYLADLRNIVCMIIKDGDTYRFSHRFFQAYFAACYTTALTDEQQKTLFEDNLYKSIYWGKRDYYELLCQLEPERFFENALEKNLRILYNDISKTSDPDTSLLKTQSKGISIQSDSVKKTCCFRVKNIHMSNIIRLFKVHLIKIYNLLHNENNNDIDIETICKYISKITELSYINNYYLSYEKIDKSELITEEERAELYSALNRVDRTPETRAAIRAWLDQIDKKRQSLKSRNYINDL
ncbi:MAG: NACHT domain-containing protein [Bacteroides sp.]|nr:NACHT domain-containing protein [Bacteroides sp.]